MIAILILLYRATLDKLVERGILQGRGGIGGIGSLTCPQRPF